ncbi:MAG: DoxX family protein [Cytophagales bacterium]|nr:MAG: DoxX family protein [Cytophagales bacterium]
MKLSLLYTAAKWLIAIILIQTLRYKFTAHPDSVYIFSTLGAEPYGRIGAGVLELIASILLIIPSTAFWGALLSLGAMSGAILAHFTQLGIVVKGDGGSLFFLALFTFILSAIVAWVELKKMNFFKPN